MHKWRGREWKGGERCGALVNDYWFSVRVAVLVVCLWLGVVGLVDNDVGAEGCAALARALEGGICPQLSKLDLSGMYLSLSVFEVLLVS